MVSVPSTHLVLFIASIAVAAGVAGAFTTEASRLSGTFEEVGLDLSEEVETDIEIITDAGGSVYNASSGNLTIHVQNRGETTLSADVEQVDVFLDGVFQPAANLTVTVQGSSSWAPDEVVEVVIDAPGLTTADHRIKVVVDGDAAVFEFNRATCSLTRDVLVFQQNSNDNLAFINRSGGVTDLGVGNIMTFGPAADFDCDGRLEAPYVTGDPGDDEWHELRIVDASGETQTLYDFGTVEVGDNYDTRLGVGDLDADGVTEVVFPDPGDSDDLYRVEVNEAASQIGTGHDGLGVGGLGDFNGDGDLDLVYLDDNGDELRYLEDTNEQQTGLDADESDSIGSPADFDGDGEVRVPVEVQSAPQEIVLSDNNGNYDTLNGETSDAVGSLATFDWNDDGTLDVVWVDNADSDQLYFTELDGTTTEIADSDGNPVDATDLGVA